MMTENNRETASRETVVNEPQDSYEYALLKIRWRLRKLNLFLHQFDEVVQELVVEQGAGTRRVEKMVNGGSKPLRQTFIRNLKEIAPDLVDRVKC